MGPYSLYGPGLVNGVKLARIRRSPARAQDVAARLAALGDDVLDRLALIVEALGAHAMEKRVGNRRNRDVHAERTPLGALAFAPREAENRDSLGVARTA